MDKTYYLSSEIHKPPPQFLSLKLGGLLSHALRWRRGCREGTGPAHKLLFTHSATGDETMSLQTQSQLLCPTPVRAGGQAGRAVGCTASERRWHVSPGLKWERMRLR